MSLTKLKIQGASRVVVHRTGWALALQSHYAGGLAQVTCSKLQKKTWHQRLARCNTQLLRALLQGWIPGLGSLVLLQPLRKVRHHRGSKTTSCEHGATYCQHLEHGLARGETPPALLPEELCTLLRATRNCLCSHMTQN